MTVQVALVTHVHLHCPLSRKHSYKVQGVLVQPWYDSTDHVQYARDVVSKGLRYTPNLIDGFKSLCEAMPNIPSPLLGGEAE